MADNEATTTPNLHARVQPIGWAILGLALLLVPPGVAAQDESPFADEDPFANDTDPFADDSGDDPLASYEEDAKAAADAVLDGDSDDEADDDANESDDPPPREESNGIPGFTAVSLVGILALAGFGARRWS